MPAPAPTAAIDVVDERNEPVGTAQRGEVLSQGLNFRTVHILVFDRRDSVLLQRISPSRERHPLRWGSSVAGYLHAGETYECAADRRLEEELGIPASLADLKFAGVTPMRDERSMKFIGVFMATAQHDEPIIQDPEHIAGLQWVSISDLLELAAIKPTLLTPSLVHIARYLRSQEGMLTGR